MISRPGQGIVIAGIKADPGPIPDLKPPQGEIAPELPERAILGAVIGLAFFVLFLGRIFHRPKVSAAVPPEHPASAIRRVLSEIPPDSAPGFVATQVAHAMRDYLRATFGLGEEELTTLELAERFGTHRLASLDLAERVQEFLRECDIAQFAPAGDQPRESLLQRAWPLIDELERQRTPQVSLPLPLPANT